MAWTNTAKAASSFTNTAKASTTWGAAEFLLREMADFLLLESGGKIVVSRAGQDKASSVWTYTSK